MRRSIRRNESTTLQSRQLVSYPLTERPTSPVPSCLYSSRDLQSVPMRLVSSPGFAEVGTSLTSMLCLSFAVFLRCDQSSSTVLAHKQGVRVWKPPVRGKIVCIFHSFVMVYSRLTQRGAIAQTHRLSHDKVGLVMQDFHYHI